MVKNTRETPGAGPIRPLNLPAPVPVEENESHTPVAVTLRRRRLRVTTVEDMWEIAEEWWRARPTARTYYRVTLEDGRCLTIFRDLVGSDWFQQEG